MVDLERVAKLIRKNVERGLEDNDVFRVSPLFLDGGYPAFKVFNVPNELEFCFSFTGIDVNVGEIYLQAKIEGLVSVVLLKIVITRRAEDWLFTVLEGEFGSLDSEERLMLLRILRKFFDGKIVVKISNTVYRFRGADNKRVERVIVSID